MAKYSSSIHYKISTSLDASGITKLQAELNKLEHELTTMSKRDLIGDKAVTDAISDIRRIENALDKAFSPRLGMMNTKTFMSELTKGGRSLTQIYKSLGPQGTAVFAQMYGQLGKIDTGMKSVSKTTDKMFNTLGNTVRWGVIASGFQYVLNSAHSAVQYMADLDKSLTNIRMVTDESKESMREFAKYANEAAKGLGNTTVAYTDAALIYAQQGYDLSDQKVLADYTLKVANATGQETGEVSEQMTALINGFQLSVEDVGSALDVMAKVANTSAADLEELATAASKVASTANTLGVTQEQLTAQIATIVSVTREAPENVGNALKTIYARFGDLKLGETLEDGTDLGKVSSTLQKIGVQVLDSSGAMRDMGLIMEDLMAIWDTLDTATKQGAAVTLAGKYQYNRLMALMENSDMYEGYYDDAINSAGTLEEMQSEYMESLAGKANALKASFEGLLSDLFNQDDFGVVIEGLTDVIDLFDQLIEAVGGGGAALTAFGAIGMNVFSNQIGRGISNIVTNRERTRIAQSNVQASVDIAKAQLNGAGVNAENKNVQRFVTDIAQLNQYAGIMSDEQIQKSNAMLEKRTQSLIQLDEVEKKYSQTVTGLKAAYEMLGVGAEAAQQGTLGFLQTLEADGVSIEEAKTHIDKYGTALHNLQTRIVAVQNALSTEGVDSTTYFERLQTTAGALSTTLEDLKADLIGFGVSEEQVTKISKVLQQVLDGNKINAAEFGRILKANELSINDLRQSLLQLGDSSKITAQEFEKLIGELYQARAAEKALAQEHAGLAAQMKTQSIASHITNIASGAMTLVFAVQSLQSLGSVLTNEDLSAGEKFVQVLMNSTMSIAMLSMAYMEFSRVAQALKAETTAQTVLEAIRVKFRQSEILSTVKLKIEEQELALARGQHLPVLTEEALMTNAVTQAKQKEITTTEILQKTMGKTQGIFGKVVGAISKIPKALGIAGVALGAAALAWGIYNQHIENTRKAIEEELDRTSKSAETRKELVNSFNETYEAYKQGNASPAELSDAAEALNKHLGDQQLAVAAAAGEWEKYNEQLQTAVNIAEQGDLGSLIGAKEFYGDRVATDWGNSAIGTGFLTTFATQAASQSALHQIKNETSALSRTYRGEYAWDIGSTPIERVHDYAKAVEILNNELAELNQAYSTGKISQETYNNSLREVNNELTNLKQLETEDFTAYKNSLVAPAELQAQNIQESLGDTSNYQAIIDAYFSDAQTRDYLESLGSWSEQLEWIISQTTNETQKLTLLLQQAYESAGGTVKNIVQKTPGVTQDVQGNAITDEWAADAVTEDILNQVKNSGLSDSQQLKFLASIDENASVGEILQQLENIKQNPEIVAALTFSPTFSNRIDETDNSISGLLEETDFSESAFNRMSADTYNSDQGYFAQARENLPDGSDIAELTDYYKAGNLTLEEYNEKLEDITSAQADLAQEAKDVTAQNLRLNKGVEKLCDSWEDYGAVLKDDASKGTSDWYEAVSVIDEAMADILNIDVGVLSNDFYENAEAMEAMEAAANGDMSAIDELRKIASQDIIQNMQITPVGDEDVAAVRAELAGLAQQLQADLDAMPLEERVTANLDDSEFVMKLNEMLANSQITAEQASNILSSMGMSGTIDYVEGTGKVPVTTYTLDVQGYDETTGLPTSIKLTPSTTYEEQITQVPVFTGTHYTGPGVTQVGGKSSGRTGGGGGGGGGGGSSYKPKTEKKLEEEPDRYQNVNAHLDRLSNNLEEIADEQDRLTGKALLDNMQKQVDLIQEQTNWHQKKLEIQQQEAAELREELDKDYGLKFDENGYITNYEAIHQKLIDEYNALVDEYNAATTEEAQEAIKERMDDLKEKIDKFNEGWERYDELMNNEIPESINTLEDLEDQIEDIRIKAFNAAVEAADNIKEVQDAWAEYFGLMSGLHPDSPFRALTEDAMKYENALDSVTAKQEDLDQLMKWLPQYQPGGVITSDNPFGENSAEFYEALQTAYQSYIEAALEAEQLYYDQIDDIIESYDDIADRIEKRMENYARLTEQLDHYASVIETLYGEEDYDNLLAIKRANQDVLESSIEQQRANLAMWQNELAKYNKETQPEIWEAIHEQVVEAEDELNGLVEEAAENTAAILEMAVDKTVKEWKDTMLGGDADWMETQWELIKQNADQYLDTVEETYELEKLRSKYNSLANDTADLNLRKRINDQMEKELAYLKEKDKLSEYDVNYANAKLEILQKQIALEEAQANKNQMKLRRDSQGNYSYVYTANQDDVENARNDLLDSEFNAYSMSKENYLTNYDNYIAAISAAAEQIKAINADTMLSEEEKAERTQWIYDNLKQYLSGIAEQIGVSEQGMLESVKYLAMDSSEIVGQNYADIAAMMEENWTEALGVIGVAVSEEFDHIIHNMDEFLDKTQEKWTEFEDHTQEWADNVNDIADEGTNGFRDIDDVIIDINGDMKELNEETESFFALINDDLGTIDSAVGKLADYEKQILGLKESSSKIRAELDLARAEIVKKDNEIRDWEIKFQKATEPAPSGGDSSGGSGGSGSGDGYAGTKYTKEQLIEGLAGNIWVYADWKNDPTRADSLTKKFNATVAKEVQSYVNKGMSALKHEYTYYKNFAPSKFDTGGYTGVWGKEGRLAMLHQKELVLNASDTSNILAAVSAIREIVSVMKADSIGSMLSVGRNSNIAANTGNNIQQNVEIYADFPAAESAAEIKAALEGLAQQAIQYSMRTR